MTSAVGQGLGLRPVVQACMEDEAGGLHVKDNLGYKVRPCL